MVVTTCSPRPMRAVQRAMLWAITCTAQPRRPLAAKRPEGRWFNPNGHCLNGERDGILDLGVAAMVGLQFVASRPSRSVMKP